MLVLWILQYMWVQKEMLDLIIKVPKCRFFPVGFNNRLKGSGASDKYFFQLVMSTLHWTDVPVFVLHSKENDCSSISSVFDLVWVYIEYILSFLLRY